MEPTKQHIREVMLFHYREGLQATASADRICAVYGPETVPIRTVQRWFERFRNGDIDIEDKHRAGRPSTVDTDKILSLVDSNPHLTVREIGYLLDVSHGSVQLHLEKSGYVNRADVWVPHVLSERNLMDRINICALLQEKEKELPFLKRMITGDEKWIVYNNVTRHRSWSKASTEPNTVAKRGITPNKVMLCIWWDFKGVVYYELLPKNETINKEKYCQQLDNLKKSIAEKRPELLNRRGVVFHHDNARPHTSLATCRRLHEFSWEVLPHPPYSPDIAPSDYHLFRSLQHSLRDKKFDTLEDVKTYLDEFLASKTKNFWNHGIMSLKKRWEEVIARGGEYVID